MYRFLQQRQSRRPWARSPVLTWGHNQQKQGQDYLTNNITTCSIYMALMAIHQHNNHSIPGMFRLTWWRMVWSRFYSNQSAKAGRPSTQRLGQKTVGFHRYCDPVSIETVIGFSSILRSSLYQYFGWVFIDNENRAGNGRSSSILSWELCNFEMFS